MEKIRNKGKCDGYTNYAKAHTLCGDKVHIYLKLNKEKEIEDLSLKEKGVLFLSFSVYFDRNC